MKIKISDSYKPHLLVYVPLTLGLYIWEIFRSGFLKASVAFIIGFSFLCNFYLGMKIGEKMILNQCEIKLVKLLILLLISILFSLSVNAFLLGNTIRWFLYLFFSGLITGFIFVILVRIFR